MDVEIDVAPRKTYGWSTSPSSRGADQPRCQWCRKAVAASEKDACGVSFCDDGCAATADANGFALLKEEAAFALRREPGDLDFRWIAAPRIPEPIRLDEIGHLTDRRKMGAAFERIGLGGFRRETVLMWFAVGPYLFHSKVDVTHENEEKRALYEAGAYGEMLRKSFVVRKAINSLTRIPMHMELDRVVVHCGQPMLMRSCLRLVAQDTLKSTACGEGTNIAVEGFDYLASLTLVPDVNSSDLRVEHPIVPVVPKPEVYARERPFQPHTLRVEELVQMSTIDAPAARR